MVASHVPATRPTKSSCKPMPRGTTLKDFILPTNNGFAHLLDDLDEPNSLNSHFAGLSKGNVTGTGQKVKQDVKGNKSKTNNFPPIPRTLTTNAARELAGTGDGNHLTSPHSQPSSRGGMYDEDARGDVDVVEFAEGPGEINAADGEVDVYVAMDSGAIGNISPKEAMPAGVNLQTGPNGINRDLVAANGGAITNHGTAEVELVTEDDKAFNCTMMVADVTRPLHSTGVVCDTGKEVLHTAKGAVVVPAGSLSKHVTKAMIMARYPRKGGLYLARYRVRAPRRPGAAKPAGFTRQGPQR